MVPQQTASPIVEPAAARISLEREKTPEKSRSALRKLVEQEWAPALLLLVLDIAAWISIYTLLVSLRHDQSFSGTFALIAVEIIQVAIIVQCLLIIGGYNPRTETRGLSYTAEHILSMMAGLALTALVLYGAATFDHNMKPGRGSILASFILFTPVSLYYRRILRSRTAETTAGRRFLVLGSGNLAAEFYRVYCSSPNNQQLEFVDLQGKRGGQRLAGPDSPVIGRNLPETLDSPSHNYSGIILAESLEHIPAELLDHLARTQFQRTRVYTLESFYEAQWRQVPIHTIDPFWPIQAGFQLSRASPYHYIKRIFDLVAASVGLLVCLPLMALISLIILVTSGRPIIFKQVRLGRDELPFTLYKFRTMRTAEESEMYTREDDPRLLRFGKLLRKLRLDELPQSSTGDRGWAKTPVDIGRR